MREVDVLIVGAGPAGAIAGATLVQEGLSVKIIEKLHMPRFVIGESLLPRCNELLQKANMLEPILKAEFQFKGGVAFRREDNSFVALDFSKNLGQKWGSSFQVKRADFDKLLIDDARDKGCEVAFGEELVAYDEVQNIIKTQDEDANTFTYKAKKVIDASGYGRVLPRLLGLEKASTLQSRRAIFTHVDRDDRSEDERSGYIFVDIIGENEAWIWNIPFSDTTTSVGVVCSEEYFAKHKMSDEEFWRHIIYSNKNASRRYKDSTPIRPISHISAYSSNVRQLFGENYILTGNASEFLDPIFSSGVTLALESGARAGELVARELKGEKIEYKKEYEEYVMMGIDVFRDYVNAWYDGSLQTILFSEKKNAEVTKKIVSILSGYVWDTKNSFVTSSAYALQKTYEMVRI